MANTADTGDRAHPIARGVSRIEDELKTLRDQPAWSMSPAETRDLMVRITRLNAAVAELEARVAAHGQTRGGGGRLGRHQYGELVGARHQADACRGAPQDPARRGVGVGGVRADPGGVGGGSAAGGPGHRISPGLARRLACRAGIIPAVLGTQSQVLDLGRRTRFHTEPQRIALAIEQGGCTAEGCDWPPGMCHAHHDQPFSSGGATSVKNGRLLCPRHHARAHDPAYTTTSLPGGKVRFHRRT